MLRVKEAIKEKGLTQAYVAERSGLTLRAMQYVCSGSSSTNVSRLAMIAEVLGVHITELFERPSEAPSSTQSGGEEVARWECAEEEVEYVVIRRQKKNEQK